MSAPYRGGFLARGLCVLVPAQLAELDAEVVQGVGEGGFVGVGVGGGQPPIDGQRLGGRAQRVVVPAQLAESDAEVVQGGGEVGFVGVGVGGGQPPIDGQRLGGRGQRVLVAGQL